MLRKQTTKLRDVYGIGEDKYLYPIDIVFCLTEEVMRVFQYMHYISKSGNIFVNWIFCKYLPQSFHDVQYIYWCMGAVILCFVFYITLLLKHKVSWST